MNPLNYDPFSDDKGGAGERLSAKKVVMTRKEHLCRWTIEDTYTIEPGTKAVRYECILDNRWCRFYLCVGHIEKWLKEWA